MAIYSFNHTKISKKGQKQPYTAAAHVRYVVLSKTRTAVLAARMPERMGQARAWLKAEEDADRKNARVADKLRIALPNELTLEQQMECIRGFAEEVTQGRAPWFAAFHGKGSAERNKHCHMIIRDRDPESGRRVIGLSERDSTEWLREIWERHGNAALARAGLEVRIDRRTLKAQGVEREAGIHIGPKAQAMAERGVRPESKRRVVEAEPRTGKARVVDYPAIDAGRTRPERAAEIINLNAERQRRALQAEVEAARQRKLDALASDLEAFLGSGCRDGGMAAKTARREVLQGAGEWGPAPEPARLPEVGRSREYWQAVEAERLAREWEQLAGIHGEQWEDNGDVPRESKASKRERKTEAVMGSAPGMNFKLPYRIVFGCTGAELVFITVEGDIPTDPFAGVPPEIVAKARSMPLSKEQIYRYECSYNDGLSPQVKMAIQHEVVAENVALLLKERDAQTERESAIADRRAERDEVGRQLMSEAFEQLHGKADKNRQQGSASERPGQRGGIPAARDGRSSVGKTGHSAKPREVYHFKDGPDGAQVRVERHGVMPPELPRQVDKRVYDRAFQMEATRFERRVMDAARKLDKEDRLAVENVLFNERIERLERKMTLEIKKQLQRNAERAERKDELKRRQQEAEEDRRSRMAAEEADLRRMLEADAGNFVNFDRGLEGLPPRDKANERERGADRDRGWDR